MGKTCSNKYAGKYNGKRSMVDHQRQLNLESALFNTAWIMEMVQYVGSGKMRWGLEQDNNQKGGSDRERNKYVQIAASEYETSLLTSSMIWKTLPGMILILR